MEQYTVTTSVTVHAQSEEEAVTVAYNLIREFDVLEMTVTKTYCVKKNED